MNKIFKLFKNIFTNYKWGLLSGVLVGTSYIPFPPWAILFCYAPVWHFVYTENKTKKEAFKNLWWTQFTLTLIGFHWIAYVSHEFGGFPWVLSIAALLLFAALMHLYIPFSTYISLWLKEKYHISPIKTLYLNALILFLLEKFWPSIFPWHLGYTLFYAKIPIYNFADIIGFEGFSLIILLVNSLVVHSIIKYKNNNTLLRPSVAVALAIVLFNFLAIPYARKWQNTDREIKITAIQGNIGNMDKIYAEKGAGYQNEITLKFLELSNQAKLKYPDTNLFIWPETAFPDYLNSYYLDGSTQKLLLNGTHPIQGLKNLGLPLLTGAYGRAPRSQKGPRPIYNSFFLVDSNGAEYSPAYNKTHLLVFGEYLPLSETYPILLKIFPFVANFGRGQGPQTLDFKNPIYQEITSFGPQICYEGLFPEFSRGLAQKGSHILANITNDSWFGWPFEPQQHMYMTFARSIETRLPLIRSTNTGITSAALANGEILEQSPLHQEWFGQFLIKYRSQPELTFYVKHASKITFLIFAIFFMLLLTSIYENRRKKI